MIGYYTCEEGEFSNCQVSIRMVAVQDIVKNTCNIVLIKGQWECFISCEQSTLWAGWKCIQVTA